MPSPPLFFNAQLNNIIFLSFHTFVYSNSVQFIGGARGDWGCSPTLESVRLYLGKIEVCQGQAFAMNEYTCPLWGTI